MLIWTFLNMSLSVCAFVGYIIGSWLLDPNIGISCIRSAIQDTATIFQTEYTNLHSTSSETGASDPLGTANPLHCSHSGDCNVIYFPVALICISLVTSNAECIPLSLSAYWPPEYHLYKCLFKNFAMFVIFIIISALYL